MPSLLHEGLIELIRAQPQFTAALLNQQLHIEVPPFAEARLTEATLNELVPVEYRADAVVVFADPAPVLGVIVESQGQPDQRKPFAWPVYVTTARARHECPFILLVLTSDPATERWAAQPIHIGGGMVHQPYVIGPGGTPKITDRSHAAREPQLGLLSVMIHGQGNVELAVAIAVAVSAAIEGFPDDQRQVYFGLIESALSPAAREIWKMAPQVQKLFSESQRKSFAEGEAKGKAEGEAKGKAEGEAKGWAEGEAKGKAEGEAKGKAEGEAKGKADAVLRLLALRGISVTAPQQARILGCTDLASLNRWLERALSATSADDLIG